MLVLNRKCNEQIVIGEGESQVVVTVAKVFGNRVTLGFAANRAIPIRRSELPPRDGQPGSDGGDEGRDAA